MKCTIYQTPMHSRLIGLTLAAVICAGFSQTTYGANLLVNPGFDYTTDGNGSAPNDAAGNVNPVTSYLAGTGPHPSFFGPGPSFPQTGTATFLGWTSSPQESAQTLDSSYFGGVLPTGATGYANPGALLTQTLAGELQPSTMYTLNVDVYSRSDLGNNVFTDYSPVVVQLQNGSNTYLAGTNGPGNIGVSEAPFANGMGHVTVTFTTGLGQSADNLIVDLGMTAGSGQVNFDNATLTAVAVPEPASLVLLACGAVGVFLVARQRNRPQI